MHEYARHTAPASRWGASQQLWNVAPEYEIVDVVAQREEASRWLPELGWQMSSPLAEIERFGLLAEHDERPASLEQAAAEYYRHYDPLTVRALPAELSKLATWQTDMDRVSGRMECIISKMRGGRTGTLTLNANMATCHFSSIEEQGQIL